MVTCIAGADSAAGERRFSRALWASRRAASKLLNDPRALPPLCQASVHASRLQFAASRNSSL